MSWKPRNVTLPIGVKISGKNLYAISKVTYALACFVRCDFHEIGEIGNSRILSFGENKEDCTEIRISILTTMQVEFAQPSSWYVDLIRLWILMAYDTNEFSSISKPMYSCTNGRSQMIITKSVDNYFSECL